MVAASFDSSRHPITQQPFTSVESTIRNIACMQLSELAEYYAVTGEQGGETDNRETRDYCSRILDLVDAVGNLKFPGEWTDAKFDF